MYKKLNNLLLKKVFVASLIINFLIILVALLSQLILPPEIPLFYGLPQTSEQLAKSIFIIIPPVVAVVINLVNIYLSLVIESTYLKKSLAISSIVVSILSAITVIKIIFLVGNI